ncbi:unnamed protein product [Allacma fusca]|uniref:Sugar phosphate transporter domain-containing protein n=1 Tax=Allacma fusca TaxID=39272 RepID=A0A8J2K0R2_9HEXA|nr:unnamed protein product [Allacma fusca]
MKDFFTKKIIQTIVTFVAWHAISAGHNILAKVILNEFNYPLTVTATQFLLTTLLIWPVVGFHWVDMSQKNNESMSKRYWLVWLLPLAVGKVITTTSSQWSLAKLSLSYVHTVKASQPIFTVAFIRIAFQKKQTGLVYLSLIPILGGVGLASYSEDTFNISGFISVLIATSSFALQNIYNKQLLSETNMHSFRLVLILSQLSLLLFAPIWLATDFRTILDQILANNAQINWLKVFGLLLADGILSFVQTLLAFVFLSLVSHLTYSVANATKRIEIILGGIIILHDHASVFKVIGMCLAVSGVFFYTFAKHLMNKNKHQTKSLDDCETITGSSTYEKLGGDSVDDDVDLPRSVDVDETRPLTGP